MAPNDIIPSPDVLHQRLDYWTAAPPISGNPITGPAWLPAWPEPGRSTSAAPTATNVPPATAKPAAALWRPWHSGLAPVPPTATPPPRATAGPAPVTAPAVALRATLALTLCDTAA